MSETLVSLYAAWRARSPALLAFGGDSAIELFSAVVVLQRFRTNVKQERAERRASRIAGALLFALAAYVAVTSARNLLGHSEPKPSLLGIAILIAAAVCMPLLAREKQRRLSSRDGQRSAQSGRSRIYSVRIFFADCLSGSSCEWRLASSVGGLGRGIGDSPTRTVGRARSPSR